LESAPHLPGRKGAARIALIPPEVLEALNAGAIPTVNLNEFLAIDLGRLTRSVAARAGLDPDAERPTHPDPSIRRFASEATRPRGVWCAQIETLKKEPWRGLPLLDPLRADTSSYVQDSVANWLNDAAKTQPQWVREVCARWGRGKLAPATAYILRRARRSLPA